MGIKVRFQFNKGRHGAPLAKLGKISEQVEKFLRLLAADCDIDARPGQWLAANFKDGSVEYDAEFHGTADMGAAQIFVRNLELLADYDPDSDGINAPISDASILEYARIGTLIDPDEEIGLGIYPARGGRPRWRALTYNKTATMRRRIEAPVATYGATQGIIHTWFVGAKEPSFHLREISTDALVRVFYPMTMYSKVAAAVQERNIVLIVSGSMLFDRATRSASELRADRIETTRVLSSAEFESFFGSAPDFEVDFSDTTAADG